MNCHKKVFPAIIARILAHTKESRASLCKRTGISKTSLNDFLGGRKDLSFDAVIALVAAFPRYNARWLLTGAKSQAMLEHQAKLDAAKVVKAATHAESVVIARLQKFSDDNDLELMVDKNERTGNFYAQLSNGDIYTDYGWLNLTQTFGDTPTYALLELAKALSLQIIRTYGCSKIITAPNFFATL